MGRRPHHRGSHGQTGEGNMNPRGGAGFIQRRGGHSGGFIQNTYNNGRQGQNKRPPWQHNNYNNNALKWENDYNPEWGPGRPKHPRGNFDQNQYQERRGGSGDGSASASGRNNHNFHNSRTNQRKRGGHGEHSRHLGSHSQGPNLAHFFSQQSSGYHDDRFMGGYNGEEEFEETEVAVNFGDNAKVGDQNSQQNRCSNLSHNGDNEPPYHRLDLQQLLTYLLQPSMAGNGEIYLKLRYIGELLDECDPGILSHQALNEVNGKWPPTGCSCHNSNMAGCTAALLSRYRTAIEALRTYLFMARNLLEPRQNQSGTSFAHLDVYNQNYQQPPSDYAPDRSFPEKCPEAIAPEADMSDAWTFLGLQSDPAHCSDSPRAPEDDEAYHERARVRVLAKAMVLAVLDPHGRLDYGD